MALTKRDEHYSVSSYPLRLYPHNLAVRASLENFVASVRGQDSLLITLADSARTVVTCLAGVKAYRTEEPSRFRITGCLNSSQCRLTAATLALSPMLNKIRAVRRLNAVAEILRSIDRIESRCASVEDAALRSFQVQERESLVQLLLQKPRYGDRRRLNSYEASVFSQSGQDGMIDEILRRIGTTNQLCVEFGVGAGGGFENNSTYLLAKGWTGCWIEADPVAGERIRRQMDFLIRPGRFRGCS